MPHCQKEFAKPPVSSKEKKLQMKAKREADKIKATKRSKDIIEEVEEARALKSPEQEAAELEAELAHARQVEEKEAETRRLQDAKKRANQAFKARNWEEALALYSKCIELDPEDHIHWSNRAAVNKHLANFEDSLADATKSTEVKPEFAKGWARLGAANAALERLDAAEEAFQHGLTLEPENVMCLDGIKDIQKKREGPTQEDELDALVKELQGLELTELQSRTLEEGLDKAKVDKATGSEAPKKALINLVVAYKHLANLILVELQGLELPQLWARALQEGLDEDVVAEVANVDDPMGALTTIIVKYLSDDLVEVLTESHAETVEDSGEEYEHSDDDIDFEVVTADESNLHLGIGEVFVAGAYIGETYGELVLPNGTRLGNRALNKFYKQRICRTQDQLALRTMDGINAKIARRAQGRLLVQNAKEVLKSAISSQPIFKQNQPDNTAMRAGVHHWGAGGGGSHYHLAGSKQYNKGNKVKGVVLRRSRQRAKLQAARNKANRGNQSLACLRGSRRNQRCANRVKDMRMQHNFGETRFIKP